MNSKRIIAILLATFVLFSVTLGLSACPEKQNGAWDEYPFDLSCNFIWNPPNGDNEVGVELTLTNNQEKTITQFTVYLFTQTFYNYLKGSPPVDSKQITVYDLNLAEGESYDTVVSFDMIFDGGGIAKSVKGNLYGTWVEFDNGQSEWGEKEIGGREEIYAKGFKLGLGSSNNPNR